MYGVICDCIDDGKYNENCCFGGGVLGVSVTVMIFGWNICSSEMQTRSNPILTVQTIDSETKIDGEEYEMLEMIVV